MDIHTVGIDYNNITSNLVEFPNLREKGFRREFALINAFVNHINIILVILHYNFNYFLDRPILKHHTLPFGTLLLFYSILFTIIYVP